MRKNKFEILYQLTMDAARQMLGKGLISREDYESFDAEMRKKYHPVIGVLFSKLT